MESPPQSGSIGAEALKHIAPGSSISVAYHPSFGPYDDLLFLELDEKLLPDVLNERCAMTDNQLLVTLSLPSASPICVFNFNMITTLFQGGLERTA